MTRKTIKCALTIAIFLTGQEGASSIAQEAGCRFNLPRFMPLKIYDIEVQAPNEHPHDFVELEKKRHILTDTGTGLANDFGAPTSTRSCFEAGVNALKVFGVVVKGEKMKRQLFIQPIRHKREVFPVGDYGIDRRLRQFYPYLR